MFLMSLSTIGFISITIIFAVFFLSAYRYRRNNQTSDAFLGVFQKTRSAIFDQHIGLIEFVILTTIGAKYGLIGFYLLVTAIIISQVIWLRYYTNGNYSTFASFVKKRSNSAISIFIAVFQIVAYLAFICFSLILMAKIFQSLLGWSYVNSVLGIAGFVLIYSIVGGYQAIQTNRIISYFIAMLAVVVTLVFIGLNTYSFHSIFANLHKLASQQGKENYFYTGFHLSIDYVYLIGMLIIGLIGLNILYNKVTEVRNTKVNLLGVLLKILVVFTVIFLGISAIGTNPENTTVKGRQIVTYQAQFDNGEVGYVVKSINNKEGDTKNTVPGIIPPLLNSKTNLIESGQYNYLLSGVVTMQHYLPDQLKFIIVLAIMVLFMASLSQYLISSVRVIVKDVVQPLKLFVKYGEIGELWVTRISALAVVFIGIVLSYFLLPGFDLFNYFNIFLTIFLTPLFVILIVVSFIK